ncbi:MAG: hypothetical protein R6U66_07225 [Bacteroidales bacterium]
MKYLYALLLLVTMPLVSFGQIDNRLFFESYPELDTTEGQVVLAVDNMNFLQNNEYFSSFAKGYTAIGFHLIPKVTYTYNKYLHFQAGANLLKFSGRNSFEESVPYLRIYYQPRPDLRIVLGNIYGTVHHNVPEPLMNPELLLTTNDESGLQFLYNKKKLHADLWVHWSKFIKEGDPFQEKFTVGFSGSYTWWNKGTSRISTPVAFMARHAGGQINKNSESLSTIVNSSLTLKYHTADFTGDSISFSAGVFTYEDLSPTKKQIYNDGYAFLVQGTQHYKHFQVNMGYWWAREFIAPLGHPLYASVSDYNPYTEARYRRMLTAKVAFQKSLTPDLRIAVRAESFFDLNTQTLDYLYGFYLQFNPRFFITRIRE